MCTHTSTSFGTEGKKVKWKKVLKRKTTKKSQTGTETFFRRKVP